MYQCTFALNNQAISEFKIGSRAFPAFSGLRPYVNKRMSSCLANLGPIPPGSYYIVDRQSGGFLGSLYDAFGQRGEWFSLYADDEKIDDEVFCNEVKRGNFRLHPKVGRGISKGCITINKQADFNHIHAILKGATKEPIPNSSLLAYGKVLVK